MAISFRICALNAYKFLSVSNLPSIPNLFNFPNPLHAPSTTIALKLPNFPTVHFRRHVINGKLVRPASHAYFAPGAPDVSEIAIIL